AGTVMPALMRSSGRVGATGWTASGKLMVTSASPDDKWTRMFRRFGELVHRLAEGARAGLRDLTFLTRVLLGAFHPRHLLRLAGRARALPGELWGLTAAAAR